MFNSGEILSTTADHDSQPDLASSTTTCPPSTSSNGTGTNGNSYIAVYKLNNFLIFGNGAGTLPTGDPALTFSGPVIGRGGERVYQNTVNATAFTGPISGDGNFDISNSLPAGFPAR